MKVKVMCKETENGEMSNHSSKTGLIRSPCVIAGVPSLTHLASLLHSYPTQ